MFMEGCSVAKGADFEGSRRFHEKRREKEPCKQGQGLLIAGEGQEEPQIKLMSMFYLVFLWDLEGAKDAQNSAGKINVI